MHFRTNVLVVPSATAFTRAILAETRPTSQPYPRSVIAQATLPSVVDKPMDFPTVNVTLKSGQKETLSGVTSIAYRVSGSADITEGGQNTTIVEGAGVYLPASSAASLTVQGDDSVTLVFQLLSVRTKEPESGAGGLKQLYRTMESFPDLKAGTYDLNLTRVTFHAGMPSNAPYHRSGAELYYVVSGSASNTIAGKS